MSNPKRIRPLQGQVLVEILPADKETAGGIALPENVRTKDAIGREPARKAKVLATGIWPTSRKGRMLSYEFRTGAIVMVDPGFGKNVNVEIRRLKLYDHKEILAALE